MALVAVLLLLMMMSALGAALAVNGETETLIARNQIAGMQAQAAAEAGLNHGLEVATEYIFDWKSNGFASIDVAVDAVLTNADAGNLDGLVLNSPLTISDGFNAQYQIAILDDDDNGVGEDGDPLNDVNDVLVVRATGPRGMVRKSCWKRSFRRKSLPAIVTNGDLTLHGNASIEGSAGSVHANGGSDHRREQRRHIGQTHHRAANWTATTPAIRSTGTATEGAPEIPVPPVHASDYFALGGLRPQGRRDDDRSERDGPLHIEWQDIVQRLGLGQSATRILVAQQQQHHSRDVLRGGRRDCVRAAQAVPRTLPRSASLPRAQSRSAAAPSWRPTRRNCSSSRTRI